jgi:hypothetical protein
MFGIPGPAFKSRAWELDEWHSSGSFLIGGFLILHAVLHRALATYVRHLRARATHDPKSSH